MVQTPLALFIVYCYLLLRRHSQKLESQKANCEIVAESWKQRWTSWGEACRRGAAPEVNVFLNINPPKNAYIEYKFY